MSDFVKYLKENSRNKWFHLLCIFLAVCIIMLPFPMLGIPDSYDLPQHIWFAETYYNSILHGDFFPGWGTLENHGFGSIGIRYYPPFAYYLLAFTQMLTGNWYDSFWINCFFWMFIGSVGIYFWVKDTSGGLQATLAAILYAIVPYHIFQIYQAMFYAEFAASGILPFCFWFLTRLIRRGKLSDVVLFSIAYSLLILTHIPTSIIGSISLGIYALLLIDRENFRKAALNGVIAFALTFAATAFHWIRLVSETDWVKHNSPTFYSAGAYNYRKQLFPLYLIEPEKYIGKMLWFRDAKVVLCSLLLLPAAIYLICRFRKTFADDKDQFKLITALFITGVFSVFILSIPSLFIWDNFVILQKIQFPWRWLSILSVLGTVSFVLAVSYLLSHYRSQQRIIIYSVVILIFTFLIFNITQNIVFAQPLSRNAFNTELNKRYEKESCRCWWTIWAEAEIFDRRDKLLINSRKTEVLNWDSEYRKFTVAAGATAENVRVATFYHPYWKAKINGNSVDVQKDSDGSILIPIPAETSQVELYFSEPLKNNIALTISLLTWLLLFFTLCWLYRKKDAKNENL